VEESRGCPDRHIAHEGYEENSGMLIAQTHSQTPDTKHDEQEVGNRLQAETILGLLVLRSSAELKTRTLLTLQSSAI